MATTYAALHRRSVEDPEGYWGEEARRIHWERPYERVLDYSRPPFTHWFVGGQTNLCHNAVDRHLPARAAQEAVVYVSSETGQEATFTYAELHREVQRFAAVLQSLGVSRGDRVLIYLPMVPEALFSMLACARIGAIHSVVFGGFAAHSLSRRIDDARPTVIVTADAGMRAGRVIPYKHLVDEGIRLSSAPPRHVLLVNRGLDPKIPLTQGRDVDYAGLREKHLDAQAPVVWLESSDPSYILYTSGTTGNPKGVQRDTGGYAVALAASMQNIFTGQPGETMFTASDVGWVVGHSYIVYGPLIQGMTTVVYEGLPIRPDPGIWWRIVSEQRASVMFTSPTAIRVLKRQDPAFLTKYDVSSLRYLFLAGEPLDEPTARWISGALGVEIIDNYWQTETGWPILSAMPGVEKLPRKFGSPGFATPGYRLKLLHEETGREVGVGEKGVLVAVPPLPPGCASTVWGHDDRFVETYFQNFPEQVYSTFDWATRDADGYYFILGRTDDVINVAGHRLGTREIEEAASGHPSVAEVAMVGVQDELKGQRVEGFVVVKDPARTASAEAREGLEREVCETVVGALGALARPSRIHFLTLLPKTRSGKLLRRSIQALAEGRDPGDLTTLEDPAALEQIRAAVASPPSPDRRGRG
ncbi:propionate--CoA ligase [Aggregicoccus sp. 17bor-14]|uniref:propionate--CoA ligase n=1 Tax=Myxococcaceae TaxID=31 RepID=UPI00129C8D16|nr:MULTISPECIES: propionate--CoA ligase [Myxococcaceae]MBF5045181.1 propionate--CoA ligase [Simulacricoccus sp. 17bor-14]MRI90922.1 propionate--CoA ligase [Aggregicoccus sp. 17bor-14]